MGQMYGTCPRYCCCFAGLVVAAVGVGVAGVGVVAAVAAALPVAARTGL